MYIIHVPFIFSFAVVVWELVTGERPYGGLNLFVVAYGVGHGSLSLPIPDGCPEPLANLMEGEYSLYTASTVIFKLPLYFLGGLKSGIPYNTISS